MISQNIKHRHESSDPQAVPVKRGRGRPPKIKRVVPKLGLPPAPNGSENGSGGDAAQSSVASISVADEVIAPSKSRFGVSKLTISEIVDSPRDHTLRLRRESPTSHEDTALPRKRTRIEVSEAAETVSEPPESRSLSKSSLLPARRSTRQATVHATQVSEGTLRPPGPPCLEAALNIALRNLESETWRYLWSYYTKNKGGPLPTPTAMKEASPSIRRAAEVVDKADRELEDAIDELMRSNARKKRRNGPLSSKYVEKSFESEIEPTLTSPPRETQAISSQGSSLGEDDISGIEGPERRLSIRLPARVRSRTSVGTSAADTT
ncbi:hypothetical protein K439DRAFT_1660831 [Ramaria rubella]|nr:hypothetical protein K439DRAFT_1660831 [Ramaria rubella]